MRHSWSFVCLMAIIAVSRSAVVPRNEHQHPQVELKYEGKGLPYDLPQHKDVHQPINPLSYPSYQSYPSHPFFYPYSAYSAPRYYPSLPYYHMPYYNNHAVLDKDAKQGKVDLKAPVYNFKAPGFDFKAPPFDFKAPAFDFKAPAYDFKAPAYGFKAPEGFKAPTYNLPQYVYQPFPLKQQTQQQAHSHPAPPPPAPEQPTPTLHQQYKEVEILPELHEQTPHGHLDEQQIVHKDEPASKSFIFIGKYSGSCKGEKDGLYYVDKKTFAYCVDQRDVFQPCPEGTENPDSEEFQNGKLQYSHHFCSVNLLAQNPEPVPTHADPDYNTYQYEEVPEEKY